MNARATTAGTRRLELAPGEAHVWFAWVPSFGEAQDLDRYRRMLAPSETQRLNRLVTQPLKLEFLMTRALCRETLSRYSDVLPNEWQFEFNPYGKPAIAKPTLATPLQFNLSNSRSVVACVVAVDAEVGIDVESWIRQDGALPIAPRIFSPSELAMLGACAEPLRARSFYELWTLKEAYVKARGMGMSMPLDQVSFSPRVVPIRAEMSPELDDDASGWHFEQQALGQDHLLALAIRRRDSKKVSVLVKQAQLASLASEFTD
jgi:4'-phosphopantetheinyl transferase